MKRCCYKFHRDISNNKENSHEKLIKLKHALNDCEQHFSRAIVLIQNNMIKRSFLKLRNYLSKDSYPSKYFIVQNDLVLQ